MSTRRNACGRSVNLSASLSTRTSRSLRPRGPHGGNDPELGKSARSWLAAAVRFSTNEARMRCSITVAWSASLLIGTKRMVGRPTASQIASASRASVLLRLT